MKIILGSDQIGYSLKNAIIDHLKQYDVDVLDIGTFSAEKPVDYPDFAQLAALKISSGDGDSGILICGTGIGMSIAANKVKGVRAALCHDPFTAHQARAHNDANILCMGAWIVSPQRVGGILDEWFATEYEGGRHQPRLLKLENPAVNLGKRNEEKTGPQLIKFGVALSPNQSVFGPLLFAGQLEEGVQRAAENGFDCVEISLRSPSDLSAEYLETLLLKYDLSLSAIATGQSCLHDGMCLAAKDELGVQGAVERLNAHIELASEFGAAVIIGGIRGKFTGRELDKSQQRQRALEAVKVCAVKAEEKNVQLLIEPINRYETNFINSAEEGIQFVEEAGHPEIKLLLDTFHMNMEEEDIHKTLIRYADRIGYIHFADSNRHAPGFGHFPFHEILKTMQEINYKGVITAEILPLPNDKSAIQQTGAFFKSLFIKE
jgi:RpiB/LacA/LacB family sugar-phosphate isomerase